MRPSFEARKSAHLRMTLSVWRLVARMERSAIRDQRFSILEWTPKVRHGKLGTVL